MVGVQNEFMVTFGSILLVIVQLYDVSEIPFRGNLSCILVYADWFPSSCQFVLRIKIRTI